MAHGAGNEPILAQSDGDPSGFAAQVEQWFEPAREVLVPLLSDPVVVGGWAVLVLACLAIL